MYTFFASIATQLRQSTRIFRKTNRTLRKLVASRNRIEIGTMEKDKNTKGLDFNDPVGTAKRYVNQKEGVELRKLHRNYARSYNSMYGWALLGFFGSAGIALVLRGIVPKASREDEKK